jgi:hypothetical protein
VQARMYLSLGFNRDGLEQFRVHVPGKKVQQSHLIMHGSTQAEAPRVVAHYPTPQICVPTPKLEILAHVRQHLLEAHI